MMLAGVALAVVVSVCSAWAWFVLADHRPIPLNRATIDIERAL